MVQTNRNILVIDDEPNMRNLIKFYLNKEPWEIIEAASGTEAIEKVKQQSFDLIILDVMMPGIDGWEVCSYIRERSHVPILLLTAMNETKDKVYGLNLGADDYLTKPFDKDEFIARIKALLRRAVPTTNEKSKLIQMDEISINPESREVYVNDNLLLLTPKEFDLLFMLAKNPNKAFNREILLEQIWGSDFYGDTRTVDQHVKNIRDKVKKAGCSFNPIQTVWGLGYKIQGKKNE
ncbi:response regulator transcription factor [Ammoniphilus sp. 3BR4]|uniref:response regulator transcription factor n=1 Tax=Ammoniphilus sp. 3BR4 TaxID=3158265 RepID=UPI00346718E0